MKTPDTSRPGRPATLPAAAFLTLLGLLAPTGNAGAAPADDEIDFGLRAGIYADASDAFLGAEILGRMGDKGWFYNPNLEWVPRDGGDLITLNADFHYDFKVDEPVYVWAGGGPALVFKNNRRNDDTDLGLNLLAGIGFKTEGPLRPYVQAKILLADDTEAVLAFGIRF